MTPKPAAFVAVPVLPSSPAAAASDEDMIAAMSVQARLPNGVAIDLRGVDLRNVAEVIEALELAQPLCIGHFHAAELRALALPHVRHSPG